MGAARDGDERQGEQRHIRLTGTRVPHPREARDGRRRTVKRRVTKRWNVHMDSQAGTALVILVPEAKTLVQAFRERYDPSAANGMPAHITILYPFKYAPEIDKRVMNALQSLFSCHSRFRFSLEETRRFPTTLYLAPRPAAPFKTLTRTVTERFPETPPYGGAFSAVVPHLTIAQVVDPQEVTKISDEFDRASRGRLPIHSHAEKIWLLEKQEGRWKPTVSFAFNGDSDS